MFKDKRVLQKELNKKLLEYLRSRLNTGEILRQEALSTVNVGNAIRAFKEEGALQFQSDGGIKINQRVWKQYIQDIGYVLSKATD